MNPVLFVALQTGSQANGGMQSVTELVSRLKSHRPIVLTNLNGDLSDLWRSRGIEVHVVPEEASTGLRHNPMGALGTYRRYFGAVTEILASSGARVVHANDPLAFQLSLAAVKSRPRTRMALNIRGTMDPVRRPPSTKYRMIFAAADHVFYLSADMAEFWRRVAPNATRASSVTYSVVDSARFTASAAPERDRPLVLVTGIISPGKCQLEFIQQVVPTLAPEGVETWFAGDFAPDSDAYASACAAAAEPFGELVRFLGYRSDVPDLIRQASVVAVPSRHEGLMRGMIEAMSCGRPVVSFDVCSAREILEEQAGGAGVVVGLGNYQGMAEAIIRYATDRNAQAESGKAGVACARALFDADRVTERYERVYQELGGR